MNFRFFQKILDKLGLVFVCSFTDDFEDYPKDFPYKMWIEKKSNYYERTEL